MIRYRNTLVPILLILLCAASAACAPAASQTGELPTLVELPTLTPTFTHTPSLTPSPTETPAPTDTPQPTATLTPTITASPTLTPTTQITPTVTLAPPTETVEIEPGETEEIIPEGEPQIISFTASTQSAAPGSQITITWEVIGQEVRLERLDATGAVVEATPLELSGSQLVIIPSGQGNQVTYRLVVFGGEVELTQLLTINIALACTINWFFGNEFVPPNAGCPTGAAESGPGAFQTFQGGVMIYVNANNRNVVYALANEGSGNNMVTQNVYSQYTVTWDTAVDNCVGRSPATGLFLPQQMFNQIGCAVLGPGPGFWVDIIGYATGPIDTSQRTIQFETSGAFYVDSPTGAVYRFTPIGQGVLAAPWSKVK